VITYGEEPPTGAENWKRKFGGPEERLKGAFKTTGVTRQIFGRKALKPRGMSR